MGTGKVIKCKKCGYRLDIWEGVGFDNIPAPKQEHIKCPKCGSEEFEDTEEMFFWD